MNNVYEITDTFYVRILNFTYPSSTRSYSNFGWRLDREDINVYKALKFNDGQIFCKLSKHDCDCLDIMLISLFQFVSMRWQADRQCTTFFVNHNIGKSIPHLVKKGKMTFDGR